MSLPHFKYHPDPIATGSVTPSESACACCMQARGYIYVGPVYATGELSDRICPWCIADGSAHTKFGAEFTDQASVEGSGEQDTAPDLIVEEVAFRTPGFAGWQQERWLSCCGEAAAYQGRAGFAELEGQWAEAIPSIQDECGMSAGPDWHEYMRALNKKDSPTAYVFECLHCAKLIGYSDCH